jgi:hypothetical protein
MSIRSFAFLLLLVTAIFARVDPQKAIRSYVVQKDLLNPIKAGQFTILDSTEKETKYRVQSLYSFMQNVELVTYPSQQVIAKLNKNFKLFLYKATISILDPHSNKWINGTIREKFGGSFIIEWNGHKVKILHYFASWTSEFRDENDGKVLARYDKKLISLVWASKYELKVYSDKLPDAIYILGLVARDHKTTQEAKTKNG